MDREMVVNLIRNRVVECPKGKSRLWVVRCFEITVRSVDVVEVDEYEACEVGDEAPSDNGRNADPKSRAGMHHAGRSVIYLKEKRVVEEAVKKRRIQAAKIQPARKSPPVPVTV